MQQTPSLAFFDAYLAAEHLGRELLSAYVESRCDPSILKFRQEQISKEFAALIARMEALPKPKASPDA